MLVMPQAFVSVNFPALIFSSPNSVSQLIAHCLNSYLSITHFICPAGPRQSVFDIAQPCTWFSTKYNLRIYQYFHQGLRTPADCLHN
jgi:hypothetical protein